MKKSFCCLLWNLYFYLLHLGLEGLGRGTPPRWLPPHLHRRSAVGRTNAIRISSRTLRRRRTRLWWSSRMAPEPRPLPSGCSGDIPLPLRIYTKSSLLLAWRKSEGLLMLHFILVNMPSFFFNREPNFFFCFCPNRHMKFLIKGKKKKLPLSLDWNRLKHYWCGCFRFQVISLRSSNASSSYTFRGSFTDLRSCWFFFQMEEKDRGRIECHCCHFWLSLWVFFSWNDS